ncbi:putative antirepressor [Nostoc phage A1]|nr:putative antirepressor [Nostoc phage A1]
MSNFDLSIASNLYNSTEQYPVDFDQAWEWLGYSRKNNAKQAFLNFGFVQNVDYLLLIDQQSVNHEGFSAQEKAVNARKETIKLTCECLKVWGMMANTDKGKEVRQYFLECERIAKSKWQQAESVERVGKLFNDAVFHYKALEKLSPAYTTHFLDVVGIRPISPQTSENDLKASLVANRLGLAFNKQIKAFETLSDALSPEAFDNLKQAYYKLAEDYAELLKIAKPRTAYIEKIIEVPVEKVTIKTEYVEIERDREETVLKVHLLERELEALKQRHEELKREYAVQANNNIKRLTGN